MEHTLNKAYSIILPNLTCFLRKKSAFPTCTYCIHLLFQTFSITSTIHLNAMISYQRFGIDIETRVLSLQW